MSLSRDRRPRSQTHGSEGQQQQQQQQQQQPVNAKTLRLFTVSSDAAADDAAATAAAHAAQEELKSSKNPRWLASREKEAKSEALRDKIIRLIDEIEAEEALDKPAMKKAWLREKKLELRRISFRQPDEILAREGYVRKARQKLRDARRGSSRQDPDGAGDADDDEGDNRDEDDDDGDSVAGARARFATSARDGTGSVEEGKDDGVFNLSPSGRISRPNPRARSLTEANSPVQPPEETRWRRHLHNMNKVVRLPLESGYKLGRFIRRRRDKAQQLRDGNSPRAGDDDDEGGWGRRVDRRAADDSYDGRRLSDVSNGGGGDPIRIVIDGNAGGVGGARDRDRGGSGSSSSSSVADIPVLQESVAKKIRDRLTVRRSPRLSRLRRSPVGSGAEENAASDVGGSGGSGGADAEKAKSKGKKQKWKLSKKDKTAKGKSGDDSEDDKQKRKAKKGKQEKAKEKEDSHNSGSGNSRPHSGARAEQLPVEFVELEDEIQ